ncbi:MAG: hypothetical protein V4675_09945 [Verrucomicrobiota bacterium]
MSVASAVLSSLAYSTAAVAAPAAGIALANANPDLPPEVKAAVWVMGGVAFLVIFMGNLSKALPFIQSVLGIRPTKDDVRRPDHPLPQTHGAQMVSHRELDERLHRIEEKVDHRNEKAQERLDELTATMQACLRDMNAAIGKLEGKLEAKNGTRPR